MIHHLFSYIGVSPITLIIYQHIAKLSSLFLKNIDEMPIMCYGGDEMRCCHGFPRTIA